MSRTGSKTKLKGKAAAKESPATDPEVSYAVYWDLRPLFGQLTIGCHRNQILKRLIQATILTPTFHFFPCVHVQAEPEEEAVPQLAWRVIDEAAAKQLQKMTVEDVAK